ncbi:hypothetical protein [Thalassospira lucentensis]|uniref:hypothetical protein n=1 Tax=Thalassospira lucentensis TaxID=168935 RepID=UPI003AA7F7C3
MAEWHQAKTTTLNQFSETKDGTAVPSFLRSHDSLKTIAGGFSEPLALFACKSQKYRSIKDALNAEVGMDGKSNGK